MISKKLAVLPLLVALAGCVPSAATNVVQASERSSGPFGLVTVADIKVDTGAAFKGLDKVAIGSFTMGFATFKIASAKEGKGGTAARNTLEGVDDATMQAVTDAAYKSFLASLQANGYTIVDRGELMANADFGGTKSYPSPYEDSSGGLLQAKNVTRYFAPTGFDGIKFFMGDLPNVMGGFATNNPTVGAAKYAAATGTKVLHVVYTLDFANNTNTTGGVLRLTTTVKMAQGLTVVPELSKIAVTADQGGLLATGNGSVTLGQPITSTKDFATVDNSTSGADIGAQAAVNVLSVMVGTGVTQRRDFTFTARPDDYKLASLDAFEQANSALVNKMASLR